MDIKSTLKSLDDMEVMVSAARRKLEAIENSSVVSDSDVGKLVNVVSDIETARSIGLTAQRNIIIGES